mmetsp:Transcript_1471/g.2705  ORF Transcript_1471/g.2705 Transcript_1471/m.2705 type:complete len:268 (-) Transcript_1471:29-832(-)
MVDIPRKPTKLLRRIHRSFELLVCSSNCNSRTIRSSGAPAATSCNTTGLRPEILHASFNAIHSIATGFPGSRIETVVAWPASKWRIRRLHNGETEVFRYRKTRFVITSSFVAVVGRRLWIIRWPKDRGIRVMGKRCCRCRCSQATSMAISCSIEPARSVVSFIKGRSKQRTCFRRLVAGGPFGIDPQQARRSMALVPFVGKVICRIEKVVSETGRCHCRFSSTFVVASSGIFHGFRQSTSKCCRQIVKARRPAVIVILVTTRSPQQL